MDPSAWGIERGYWDALGHWHDVPGETLHAVANAMGMDEERHEPPETQPLWCVRAGRAEFLHSPADVVLEEGTVLRGIDVLPPDLPLGYHELIPRDGGPSTRLVVSPGRCHLPPGMRSRARRGCGRGAGRCSSTPRARRSRGASVTSAISDAPPSGRATPAPDSSP